MSKKVASLISPFIRINENEKLAKAIDLFDKNTREILVFDDNDNFTGYLTKRFLARQSKIFLDSKVSSFVKKVPTVTKDQPIDVVARLLIKSKIRSVPVEENGKIIGVIRDIDIILSERDLYEGKKAEELMTPAPITVSSSTTAAQLISVCRNNNISRCPVINEKGELIGIVSPHDLKPILLTDLPGQTLGDRAESQIDPLSTSVGNLMTPIVVTCRKSDSVLDAISKLSEKDHKALVVVDDENKPVGILTTRDLLETVSVPPTEKGYYINVMGDVDDEDLEQVLNMGTDFVKKYANMIGDTGHFYIHVKAIPKKKFRGYVLYQVRLRVSTDKGKTYVARSEGYGLFGSLAIAIDHLERDIISEREKAQDSREKQKSTRYLLEELEEIE
ncbi:MAG: CBS domain-containing protein [Candidatus Heimdallarchaeaceae archaeon]